MTASFFIYLSYVETFINNHFFFLMGCATTANNTQEKYNTYWIKY